MRKPAKATRTTSLKGNFRDWNYEAYIAYGKTKEAQNSSGQVNVMSLRNALEAIPGADRAPASSGATRIPARYPTR